MWYFISFLAGAIVFWIVTSIRGAGRAIEDGNKELFDVGTRMGEGNELPQEVKESISVQVQSSTAPFTQMAHELKTDFEQFKKTFIRFIETMEKHIAQSNEKNNG